jgi:hypothetical protein
MTVVIAKYKDKIVRIVKTQRTVQFSNELDWILIEYDIDLPQNRRRVQWVPASTRFTWARDYSALL